MEINLDKIKEQDLIKILFAENPGIVIQVSDKHRDEVKRIMEDAGVGYVALGKPTVFAHILVSEKWRHLPVRHRLHARCVVLHILPARPQAIHERLRQETFRELQDANRWNLRSSPTSQASSPNLASTRTAARHRAYVQSLSTRKARTASVRWHTPSTWQFRRKRRDRDWTSSADAKHWKDVNMVTYVGGFSTQTFSARPKDGQEDSS